MAKPAPDPIPPDIKLIEDIIVQDTCDFKHGHCFGGTNGGDKEVWTLDKDKKNIEKQEIYTKCRHCQKYIYNKVKDEE